MKNYYYKKDGYRETIQQGLIGARSFGNMSSGNGAKEEKINFFKDRKSTRLTPQIGRAHV